MLQKRSQLQLIGLLLGCLVAQLVTAADQTKWVDPDTDEKYYTYPVPQDAISFDAAGAAGKLKNYTLIFSDEFSNTTKRRFEQGFDDKWTALEHRDLSNMGQHYFSPQAVQTDHGDLIITTSKPKQKYRNTKYVSGSVQTWNKFCFTSGFTEVRAILPGKWGIPGTWPAIWLMGNIGRAAYLESQDGTWPWSFDYCAPWIDKTSHNHQKINACGNLTDKHDPNSYPERYGLNPNQGRGATEIDIMEGMVSARGKAGQISTSLQISPSLPSYLRPQVGAEPGPGMWYQNLTFGKYTEINKAYYGDDALDSLSALTQLNFDAFDAYHLYQLDWAPGPSGYLRWWMDSNFLFEIPGHSLSKWVGKLPPRQVPVEPSYLILSTAVSEKFSPPCEGQICDSIWPSNFTIDYVRVYQDKSNPLASIGCDLKEFPSKKWIETHPVLYGLPWYITLPLGTYLLNLFAVLTLVLSISMCFCGKQHQKTASLLFGGAMSTGVSYAFINQLVTEVGSVHIGMSIFCGIVLGGLGIFVSDGITSMAIPVLLAIVIVPVFPSIWLLRLTLAIALVGVAVVLRVAQWRDVVSGVGTTVIGGVVLVLSIAQLLSSTAWNTFVWSAGQCLVDLSDAECSQNVYDIGYPLFQVILVLLFTACGLVYQFCMPRSAGYSKMRRSSSKDPSVADHFASTMARTLGRGGHSDETASNLFVLDDLPQHMKAFEIVQPTAVRMGDFFGFQNSNVRNQTEHLIVLLANSTRRNEARPIVHLHAKMFQNYHKWCDHLSIKPLTSDPRKNLAKELTTDLCLLFLIWGEASNMRHTPEFLMYLFHHMKQEFLTEARPFARDDGFFLDTVITPVFKVIKANMHRPADHEERRNYDDLNEFFWTKECLNYNYKCRDENDRMFAKTSIAYGYAQAFKTHLEKRVWLSPLRSFWRIFAFLVVSFHCLAAVAIAEFEDYDIGMGFKLVSSVFITPFVLSICVAFIDMFMCFAGSNQVHPIYRAVCHTLTSLVCSGVLLMLYYVAMTSDTSASWVNYWACALVLHIPGLCNALVQVCPSTKRFLLQSKNNIIAIVRSFLSPLHNLYVGDNVYDEAAANIGYQFYWVSMIVCKLMFSYRFEVAPLIQPSVLLYRDHLDVGVGLTTTVVLIGIQWVLFFIVFVVDFTIWNSIWMAFAGTFVGFSARIGEIRNFKRVRLGFFQAVENFNSKLVAVGSKTGGELLKAQASTSYGSTATTEVLELNSKTGPSAQEPAAQTPLLSFTRRRQTTDEIAAARRQKWGTFSNAWNAVIHTLRDGDLISNKEQAMLEFQVVQGCPRQVFLPLFQLAGSVEKFVATCGEFGQRLNETLASKNHLRADASYELEEELTAKIQKDPMVEEAVSEVWDLTRWIMLNLMGPCHSNDIHYICAALTSWSQRKRMLYGLNANKVAAASKALAGVVGILNSNVSKWKKSAKFVPKKRSPAEYAGAQFPAGTKSSSADSSGPVSTSLKRSGMKKSASTTGLATMAGKVPRRSLGAGVARIAAMQSGQSKRPTHAKTEEHHSVSSSDLNQVRDKLRAFFNAVKGLLIEFSDTDEAEFTNSMVSESRGIADRITWMLTQECGFMWDNEYAGDQVTLFAFEADVKVAVGQLQGLLQLRKIDAEPQHRDARRRLLFFVNSLFMDMPKAPTLEEMYSYSVMTPFYGEDVMYSKSDLETKKDGLDVHTLLYLQTLYKQDWNNFVERVKPRKNIWKDEDAAMELRLWASLRGQTLTRTVQGMMYGEAAIRLLAQLEQIPEEQVDVLVKQKFTYVVACQIYGRQKKNNDPKAKDIEYLLHRFPNLRVAYIDEERVNYSKEHSYYSVLIKSAGDGRSVEEVYRVRLPGNPILGEGKPENQNSTIIFTRGESLQTIDMNQDGYLEECLKMRNVLQEFDAGTPDRPYTIVGLPEHIFTGSVSSLANYMALQETSFVTLGQRTLAHPLRMRLHYGHPDVFNKLFFMQRGGISKASKGINLSEDIFAGYNNCLRGGSVAFPEYAKVGKGRDVGMQQIYKFEAKLAQGAAEQSLSRDVYRLGQRLDFFKLLSFYFNHVGFYLNMSFICWTVFMLGYINLVKSLLQLEDVAGRSEDLFSTLQVVLGFMSFLTTAPLLATLSVEHGFKAALQQVAVLFITGGPLYFLFHIGTKWFYFGQTILAGGAKYRATGRGFVTKHARFDDLFRFYASSHLYAGFELGAMLILFAIYSVTYQYWSLTWSLWLVVASWCCSPFWFNPLAFEWRDVMDDITLWSRWMRGDGGDGTQSWVAWFEEENAYLSGMKPWAKAAVCLKACLYICIALALLSAEDAYHGFASIKVWLPVVVVLTLALLALFMWGVLFRLFSGETGMIRVLKLLYVLCLLAGVAVSLAYVGRMIACLLAFYYIAAAAGSLVLVFCGSKHKFAQLLFKFHDYVIGFICLTVILILSSLYVPNKIQTWLLYNNALSRGVVIEDILRGNTGHDEDDEMSTNRMRSIIVEQQKVIAMLTNGSDGDDAQSVTTNEVQRHSDLQHIQSENALSSLRDNASENDLTALLSASKKLTELASSTRNVEERPIPPRVMLRSLSIDSSSSAPAPPSE